MSDIETAFPQHVCELCERGFTTAFNLKRHMNRKKPCVAVAPTINAPNPCPHCGKGFASHQSMQRHVKTACKDAKKEAFDPDMQKKMLESMHDMAIEIAELVAKNAQLDAKKAQIEAEIIQRATHSTTVNIQIQFNQILNRIPQNTEPGTNVTTDCTNDPVAKMHDG